MTFQTGSKETREKHSKNPAPIGPLSIVFLFASQAPEVRHEAAKRPSAKRIWVCVASTELGIYFGPGAIDRSLL